MIVTQKTDRDLIRTTLEDYVCANCWTHLTMIHREGVSRIVCAADEDHQGFVTAAFAEREENQALENFMDAKKTLQEIGAIEKPDYGGAEKILKDLGF